MRLGILGTMVWDRIDHPAVERVERWGGIAYSLAAAAAVLPEDWVIRPIVKVGRDLAVPARAFLDSLPGLERPGGVVETPEPNNRVHLRYEDHHHRHECLTGGVSAWRWGELAPHLTDLDALFVNLISGFELELATAERLRREYAGFIYADFHSLLLGVGEAGRRVPRPLPERDRWLDAFDIVQVNEWELALVAGDDAPDTVVDSALGRGLRALLVTRGPRGAEARLREGGRLRRIEVPPHGTGDGGDPTGCGDVWGATCFVALVAGASITEAAARGNRAAARNLAHRGAEGLYEHLRVEA